MLQGLAALEWIQILLFEEIPLHSLLHTSKNTLHNQIGLLMRHFLTRRDRKVVNFTRYRVKNYSELTNFRKLTRIEWHNGK